MTWGSHSTCKVVNLGKKISSAICCKLFSQRKDFVLSNDQCSMLKVSLAGFVNAGSGPCGHLRPV